MKNAIEILISAPDAQVKRCQLAVDAIAAGRWDDAERHLSNASSLELGIWAAQASELAGYCATQNCKRYL